MARIVVHVEGQTEETFVNEILKPHLLSFGHSISARIIGNARGGICSWEVACREIMNHLKSTSDLFVTTMVDYYALPISVGRAWPGRAEANRMAFARKAPTLHKALRDDLTGRFNDSFNPARFIPYVMMYEFEGLLFSDCVRFASGIGRGELAADFQAIRDQFMTPEEINDSPFTAPSKRVQALVPGYTKPLLGNLAALEIGLGPIRAECPVFREWLTALESLPQ